MLFQIVVKLYQEIVIMGIQFQKYVILDSSKTIDGDFTEYEWFQKYVILDSSKTVNIA